MYVEGESEGYWFKVNQLMIRSVDHLQVSHGLNESS